MITVVIPSYNRRAFTARAVRSVLAQTHQDFEVLVIDDHSRPEEVYQPEPGAEGRVRVIRHEANAGVSAARNTGVAEAKGRLIAFLDSDDYWLPCRLEEHLALFDAQGDPEKVLIYSAYYTNDKGVSTLTAPVALKPRQAVGDYLFLEYGCLHVNTWLASKKLLERFPFDTRLAQSEDWDVVLRMEAGGIQFVHSARPAAVRHVDPRADRLTTVTNLAAQTRFLEENKDRLGPRAALLFEAIFREQQQPRKSALGSLWFKIRFLGLSRRLGLGSKVRLMFHYIGARLRHKFRSRWSRRRLNPAAEI